MDCVASAKEPGRVRQFLHQGFVFCGLVCGLTLTCTMAYAALFARTPCRSLLIVMIAANLLMMVPWHLLPMPQWFEAGLAIARGFHWVVNLMFASFGLFLLTHAGQPRRAMEFGAIALMFALWAAAARRITYRDRAPAGALATPGA